MIFKFVLLNVSSHALHAFLRVVGVVFEDAPLKPELVLLAALHRQGAVSTDIKWSYKLDHSGSCVLINCSWTKDLEANEAREINTIDIVCRYGNKLVLLLFDVIAPHIEVFNAVRDLVPLRSFNVTNESQLLTLCLIRLVFDFAEFHGNAYLTRVGPDGRIPDFLGRAVRRIYTPIDIIRIAIYGRVVLILDLDFTIHVGKRNAQVS